MTHAAINTLLEGTTITGTYAIHEYREGTTRKETPYTALTLGDSTGRIEARLWRLPEDQLGVGAVVEVRGKVSSYRGAIQLELEEITPVFGELGDELLGRLMPVAKHRARDWRMITKHVEALPEGGIKALLVRLLESEHGERLRKWPAARGNHHACVGGLAAHVASMLTAASILHHHYTDLDDTFIRWDLVVAGILLHDLGKTREYSFAPGFPIDSTVHHITHGVVILVELAYGLAAEGLMVHDLERLQHLIESHHGRVEWSSPNVPSTPEACFLHLVDLIDSRMDNLAGIYHATAPGAWSTSKTSFGAKIKRSA